MYTKTTVSLHLKISKLFEVPELMATEHKPKSYLHQTSKFTLIASYWLRKLTQFRIKIEHVKTAPVQLIKYTRQRSPIFSFHVIPIIVRYSLPLIPTPFKPCDGPLRSLNDDIGTVVVDLGTSSIRAGWAGDDAPFINIPSAVAIQRNSDDDNIIIGNQVTKLQQESNQKYIIKKVVGRGKIIEWDYIKPIFEYILKGIQIEEISFHIIPPRADISKEDLMKFTQMFFEKMDGWVFAVWPSSCCSVYSCGYSTTMCIDFGYSTTSIIPVFEGNALAPPFGGKIIEYGKQDMMDEDWKGFVKKLEIGKCVMDAVTKVGNIEDKDIMHLMQNVCIVGGNSMYEDIDVEKIIRDEIVEAMRNKFGKVYEFKVVVAEHRADAAWIGGSILGSMMW